MLCDLPTVQQAAVGDCLSFDPFLSIRMVWPRPKIADQSAEDARKQPIGVVAR
jgi:hypothetical protein